MVDFAGWRMPVQYAGIIPEHRATRESCGIFDISHMGQLLVSGEGAGAWLERQLTNEVADLDFGQGQYTLMLREDGGVIDDLILYALGEARYLLIVNASMIEEDEAWLRARLTEGVVLENVSEAYGGIAVQGPKSAALAQSRWPGEPSLPPRNRVCSWGEPPNESFLCRTGYTGEDGFEIFVPRDAIADEWRRFLELGATPCGLGARDTLRLEMGYPLNGSDLRPDRTPLEAGLGFFVKLDKENFSGKARLVEQKTAASHERLVALAMDGKGPPLRAGYAVVDGENELGVLSSGCLSPSLGKGIAMAYLPRAWAKPGQSLEILVRGKRFPVTTVKKPFYRPKP